ncbi:hypothetical protein AgCh_009860 [Apium graveolens]
MHNFQGRNVVDDRSWNPHKFEAFTYSVELFRAYTSYHLDVNSLHVASYYVLTNMREVEFYIMWACCSSLISSFITQQQIDKMNRTKLPIRERIGNVPQFPVGVDAVVAEIVDPIERPNEGPNDVYIEDVAVEDVVREGIVAE